MNHRAQPNSRPSISPDFNFRSICRSSDCIVNRRRSCPRFRGHASAGKRSNRRPQHLSASCQLSADYGFALPLRCSRKTAHLYSH